MSNPEVAIKPKISLKAPPMYKVVYVNDSATSFTFVIDSLVDHFGYASATAEKIAHHVHSDGSAVAAVLPYEVAEQKGIEITVEARKQGYPLQIMIEQEED